MSAIEMSAAEITAMLKARKEQLESDLAKTEKTIYELETKYLAAEYSQAGTVLKGLDGFLSSKDALKKRSGRGFKVDDRLFSLSSIGSPATAEAEAAAAAGGGRNNNNDGDDDDRRPYSKVYASKGQSFASKGRRGSGI